MKIKIVLLVLLCCVSLFERAPAETRDSQKNTDAATENVKNAPVEHQQPHELSLYQNYPNPFNAQTLIKITTPGNCFIELAVYDARGRRVRTLVSSIQPAGLYFVPWEGTDDFARQLPSGIYYYRMKSGDFVDVKRMLLLR